MTSGDRGLERVRSKRATELLGPFKRGETTADEELIPQGAVLIEEQDGLPRRADPRPQARPTEPCPLPTRRTRRREIDRSAHDYGIVSEDRLMVALS